MIRRIIAGAAAACILFTSVLGLNPARVSAEANTIHISTVEELKAFSNNCKLDSYSQNLVVELDCDLDLYNIPFTPIPSFMGTFHGNDHTIRGFVCANDGSNQGFFRYIEASGAVYDLNIEGEVSTETGQANIGGLAGTNYGTVNNCSFTGEVTGLVNVGCLVGYNEGTILKSSASGEVLGKNYTGGICGYNVGSIGYCTNDASVNIQVQEASVDFEQLSLLDIANLETVSSTDSDIVMDTGGIVGGSEGVVKDCTNNGTVGYQHYGYNVGGIAGRQFGFMTGCENYGDVYGRKDVGGICGQMEPYLYIRDSESLADDLQDLNDSISYAMSNLSANATAMQGALSALAGQTSSATTDAQSYEDFLNSLYGTSDDSSDSSAAAEAAQQIGSDLSGMVDGLDDQTKSDIISGNITDDTIQDVQDSITENGGSTGEAVGEITDRIESDAGNISDSTIEDITSGNITADDVTDIADAAINSGAAEGIQQGVDAIQEQKAAEAAAQAAQQQALATALSDVQASLATKVQAIGTALTNLNNNLAGMTGQLASDLENVNAKFEKVNQLMTRILTGDMTYYDDISALDTEEDVDGKISYCTNYGAVEGDTNIGGVSGEVALEKEFDAEETLTSNALAISGIVAQAYETRAVIRSCSNEAPISAKKNYAGGIAGKASTGIILYSENYGDISAEAQYVGGVVGDTDTRVIGSYAMCNLSGTGYVGGIAGNAAQVTDSLSMVSIADEHAACIGAIAGYIDVTVENSAVNNFFISDSLGAIDGISYAGKAEPTTSEELFANDTLPDDFRKMIVTFEADGVTIKIAKVEYGKDLESKYIPEVPEKEGYTGEWEDVSLTNITSSITVEALYYPKQSSLSTKELREDGLPILLVEGEFAGTASVSVTDYEGDLSGTVDVESESIATEETEAVEGEQVTEIKGDLLEAFTISINQKNLDTNEEGYQVRYLAPDKQTDVNIYRLCANGGYEELEYEVKGSYLSFRIPDSGTTIICTVEKKTSPLMIAAVCIAVLAVLVILIRISKRKGKKKAKGGKRKTAGAKKRKAKGTNPEEEKPTEA